MFNLPLFHSYTERLKVPCQRNTSHKVSSIHSIHVYVFSLFCSDFEPAQSSVKFSDIGGCDGTVEQVCKLLVHMRHPEVFRTLGVTPPRGFLLHGPPGCGKTLLAHAIAGVGSHCIPRYACIEVEFYVLRVETDNIVYFLLCLVVSTFD